jgi:hypothetical protein
MFASVGPSSGGHQSAADLARDLSTGVAHEHHSGGEIHDKIVKLHT